MTEQGTLFLGYDAEADMSYLLTVWPDGTHEFAYRPGRDNYSYTWSPPVRLQPVAIDGTGS